MSQMGIQFPIGQRFLAPLVDGEIDGVSRAGAESHGGNASVKPSNAVGFEDGFDGVMDGDGFDGAASEGLHLGLDSVDGEHGHVFDHAGDGAGDHELPVVEAVVDRRRRQVGVVMRRWGEGVEVGVLEFGGDIGGH